MTIRSITPPPGEDWTKWHEARDGEVRAGALAEVKALGDKCFEGCKTESDHWACCEDFWLELEDMLLAARKP